jgi:acetyltransferase-like isoleucine patch superfamily enzyme
LSGIETGVFMYGRINLGRDVSIGRGAEINAGKSGQVTIDIGDGCDIASNVTITALDSHAQCIGLAGDISRKPVVLEDHVFVGQGATILGGSHVGHHSVIGAGAVVSGEVPPYSRVRAPAPVIEPGFYQR